MQKYEMYSPEELANFVKINSSRQPRKYFEHIEYAHLVMVRVCLMKGYDMAIYEVKLGGLSGSVVYRSIELLYEGLNVPEISGREKREWNSNVRFDMMI